MMLSIRKTKSMRLGMFFLVVSLAFASMSLDWSVRGNALISAWEEMAGLFAFGYHPVSATEWATLNNVIEPLCPESDLPGRQRLAINGPTESASQSKPQNKIPLAKILPARLRCRKGKARSVVVAARIESDDSFLPVALDFELPVYTINVAELMSYEESAEVEEFTARALSIARHESDLKRVLCARESAGKARNVFRPNPTLVELPARGFDSILKIRLRKSSASGVPAPSSCGP